VRIAHSATSGKGAIDPLATDKALLAAGDMVIMATGEGLEMRVMKIRYWVTIGWPCSFWRSWGCSGSAAPTPSSTDRREA